MSPEASVVSIHIAAKEGAPTTAVDQVEAVAQQGLRGDRYFSGDGTFSRKKSSDRNVTLIESEAVAAVARDYGIQLEAGSARRNIVTRGVALNHLVGREFRVGAAVLRGVKLCEPCGYLEKLTLPGVRNSLIHRGGLRAEIVGSGVIRSGDAIGEI